MDKTFEVNALFFLNNEKNDNTIERNYYNFQIMTFSTLAFI